MYFLIIILSLSLPPSGSLFPGYRNMLFVFNGQMFLSYWIFPLFLFNVKETVHECHITCMQHIPNLFESFNFFQMVPSKNLFIFSP